MATLNNQRVSSVASPCDGLRGSLPEGHHSARVNNPSPYQGLLNRPIPCLLLKKTYDRYQL